MDINGKQHIVNITKENIQQAIEIRRDCYLQDYIDILPEEQLNTYDYTTDLNKIAEWLFESTEDFRSGYLIYLDQVPIGMVMGSMANLGSNMETVELNYLFVSDKARGIGIGEKLIVAMAIEYSELGVKSLMLYNWRELKSNGFYRHLSPDRIETIVQHPGGKALETDIFYWNIQSLLKRHPLDKIVWFSGTGSVQHVAEQLRHRLLEQGKLALVLSISDCLNGYCGEVLNEFEVPTNRLFLLYPVYALAEPVIVKQWLDNLNKVNGVKAVVLSVSGGGEIWPNTSCRRKVIQLLTKKGYDVVYERMLVMPANMLVETEPDLVAYLMQVLPLKLKDVLLELEQGNRRRERIKLSSFWLRFVSEAEQKQSRYGSKYFQVSDRCTRCGHCIDYCPVQNLHASQETGLPVFEDHCLMCLKCYYNCPVKAIESPKLEKWLLKRYNMSEFLQLAEREPEKSVEACCKGWIWLGVKRYLQQIKY